MKHDRVHFPMGKRNECIIKQVVCTYFKEHGTVFFILLNKRNITLREKFKKKKKKKTDKNFFACFFF